MQFQQKHIWILFLILIPVTGFSNEISIEEELSKQETVIDRLTILVVLLSAGLLFFVLVFLNQRKIVQQNKSSVEVEKRFLRAQLNPHFIFNTLSAIQQFVYNNDQRKASKFLAEFSKFVRSVLDNSRKDFVLLSEEITVIEHYLNLQKMKFGNFDYTLTLIGISPDMLLIPPSFIQPIIENSIEHGFNGIDHEGHIELIFKELDRAIEIVVIDNGRGFVEGIEMFSKEYISSSTTLIKNRVEIFAEEFGIDLEYSIFENKIDEKVNGTTTCLQLPVRLKE